MRFVILLLTVLTGLRSCLAQLPGAGSAAPAAPAEAPAAFSLADYRTTLHHFQARREALAAQYRQATTVHARTACLAQARTLLLTTLDSTVFPAWEGTSWEFYGTSWQPRQGSIACGYFVTTTLHDAGLRLQRTVLAKQASEVIIKNLTSEPYIYRYWNLDRAEFVHRVQDLGPGLYVLGLDFHAAFLRVREGGAVQMIHSSYLGSGAVTLEAADAAQALDSGYRVVGKVSADPAFLRAWLLQTPLAVRGATVKN